MRADRNDYGVETQAPKPKKKSKKKARRFKKFLIFDAVLLAVVVVGVFAFGSMFKSFELVGDADMVVNVGEEFADPGTTSKLAKAEGDVDTSKVGDYTVTYTKGGKSLTRNVHVVDGSRVVIGLKGSMNTVVREGDPYIESGAFIIDKDKGPVDSSTIKIKGDVDTSKPGKYEVKYTGKSGYVKKSITRTVTVVPKNEFKANTSGVPVLMYHYIYTASDKPSSLNVNYTIDTDFEAQLKYLTENGYYFPSFTELRAFVDGKIALPEKSIILTFDDAQWGFFKYGVPLLEKYRVPATSFVIGTQNGADKVRGYANPFVQFQSHSYDMHKGGGNIGHGGVISAMTKDEIVKDLQTSFAQVGNSNALAYPFGDVTDTAKTAIAAAGLDCAFTTADGKIKKGDDFRALPRVRVSGGNTLSQYVSRL